MSICILLTLTFSMTLVQAATITTVAGSGAFVAGGPVGDGGSAIAAQINPYGVALDSTGNLYIADHSQHRIRKVTPGGVITTVAGNGSMGFSGDGGLATSAQLNYPQGVMLDGAGNLYIADTNNHRIRKVANGIISTIAGNGAQDPVTPWGTYSGDGGLAVFAGLNFPKDLALDSVGNLYIADTYNQRIRKITGGIITTYAGNGSAGFFGDGGLATNAQLIWPGSVAIDSLDNVYIAEAGNANFSSRIRKITVGTQAITTAAVGSSFHGVRVDSADDLYISDLGAHKILKLSVVDGTLSTVVGTGGAGFLGDGGIPTNAQLHWPRGIAIDTNNSLYIADQMNHRIRKVGFASNSIPPAQLQCDNFCWLVPVLSLILY